MKKTAYLMIGILLVSSVAAYGAGGRKPVKPPAPKTNNPTVATILNSATAKAFTNREVDRRVVDMILQCGIKAPSAMNQQPWHFTVIRNRELLDRMDADAPKPPGPGGAKGSEVDKPSESKAIGLGEHKGSEADKPGKPGERNSQPVAPGQTKRHLFYRAPVVILISASENSKFATFDAALACQNMSLAAQSMGLGTHIVAAMQLLFEGPKGDEYRKILKIPEGKRPLAALAIGWPANPPDAVSGATTRNSEVITVIE